MLSFFFFKITKETYHYLSRDVDVIAVLVRAGALDLVGVVEYKGDGGFLDSGLSVEIYELLQFGDTCLGEGVRRSGLTNLKVVKPRQKQMASKMFDFPEPFRPVTALNWVSRLSRIVFFPYDLNPSSIICFIFMLASLS